MSIAIALHPYASCSYVPPAPLSTSGPALIGALNQAARLAEAGNLAASLDTLRRDLNRIRDAAPSPAEWREQAERHVRPHPAHAVALENPFVHRCHSKPRGYAGDAVMLDFIYRHPANRSLVGQATPRGRALLELGLTTPATRAVRNRCRLLAEEIDALCLRTPRAEILSLACGHLREAEYSSAIASREFSRFVAIDQDDESLATVSRDHAPRGIKAVPGSVKTVIARGARELGRFDFIYAAGLYDYLNDRLAAKLLSVLFGLLRPGGKLWIANFVPGIPDAGYMEAIMDWWLIYRDAQAMRGLADSAFPRPVQPSVASLRTFEETERNIVFLEVVKA